MQAVRERLARIVLLAMIGLALGVPRPAGASDEAYGAACDWLFQRYSERGVAASLRQAATLRPEARDALSSASDRIVAAIERHRDAFCVVMVPALRASFDSAQITNLVARFRQVPLALDPDSGSRLLAADSDFRRNGQQIISAIGADIDLLVGEVVAPLGR